MDSTKEGKHFQCIDMEFTVICTFMDKDTGCTEDWTLTREKSFQLKWKVEVYERNWSGR